MPPSGEAPAAAVAAAVAVASVSSCVSEMVARSIDWLNPSPSLLDHRQAPPRPRSRPPAPAAEDSSTRRSSHQMGARRARGRRWGILRSRTGWGRAPLASCTGCVPGLLLGWMAAGWVVGWAASHLSRSIDWLLGRLEDGGRSWCRWVDRCVLVWCVDQSTPTDTTIGVAACVLFWGLVQSNPPPAINHDRHDKPGPAAAGREPLCHQDHLPLRAR